MPSPARLRDSTQIVLSPAVLDGLEEELTSRFVVTIVSEDDHCRIIGSPVVIKEVNAFLAKHGVSVQ